jgi:hypothetical protein
MDKTVSQLQDSATLYGETKEDGPNLKDPIHYNDERLERAVAHSFGGGVGFSIGDDEDVFPIKQIGMYDIRIFVNGSPFMMKTWIVRMEEDTDQHIPHDAKEKRNQSSGLSSKYDWIDARIVEICAAIVKNHKACTSIPDEWHAELIERLIQLKKLS